jgi:hypothetical protein
VRSRVATADGMRVALRPGEHMDLRFDAPPPPAEGVQRTVTVRLRGYYALDIGGHRGVEHVAGARVPTGAQLAPALRAGIVALARLPGSFTAPAHDARGDGSGVATELRTAARSGYSARP